MSPLLLRSALLSAAAVALVLSACADASPVDLAPRPGAVRFEIVSGDAQEAPAATELPAPLVVRALDQAGTPLAGQIVNWVVTAGGGRVFAGVGTTNSQGIARDWWTLGDTPGENSLEVRAVDNGTGERLVFATFRALGNFLYDEAFEHAPGSEWSIGRRSVTPVGGRGFLGEFGNEVVTLSLANLPEHTALTISFDVYVLRSMDGYSALYGPELFDFSADGQSFLTTVFAMGGEQAFPGQHGQARNPGLTGASEVNSLGYQWGGGVQDAVFPVLVRVPHTAATAAISFAASGLQDYRDATGAFTDESWGIDNVRVGVER